MERDFSISLVQLPGQSRISPEMRPGCSRLCPVTAQPLWITCSHGKVLAIQLSCSEPAFSSGWGKKTAYLHILMKVHHSPLEKNSGNSTTQPCSSSELNKWLWHWYNMGAELLNLVQDTKSLSYKKCEGYVVSWRNEHLITIAVIGVFQIFFFFLDHYGYSSRASASFFVVFEATFP